MNDSCLQAGNYVNLLKPLSEIGTEFTQELLAQQEVLRLARLFGISRTLSLISITGVILHLTPKEEKAMWSLLSMIRTRTRVTS